MSKETKEVKLPSGFSKKVSFRSSNGVWSSQKQAIVKGLIALKPETKLDEGNVYKKDQVKSLLERINADAKKSEQTPHAMNIFAAWARNGYTAEDSDGNLVFVSAEILK